MSLESIRNNIPQFLRSHFSVNGRQFTGVSMDLINLRYSSTPLVTLMSVFCDMIDLLQGLDSPTPVYFSLWT